MTDPLVTAITESDRIVVSVDIGVPPGPVWQALTGADCIAGWWGDHVSFDARAGGRLVERWTDAGGRNVVTSGEVVRLTAPRELVLTWADGDWPVRTRVRFVLEEVADGTRLTLTHSGWDAFPPSRRGALIRDHALGWSRHLASLAGYAKRMADRVDRGRDLPEA